MIAMASTPTKTTTTKTVNNKTGVTTSSSTAKSGKSTTTTKTTTIGKPKTTSSSSSTSTAAKAPGAVLADRWITGPNTDGWVMCAPVAIANHLLAVTGIEAGNAAIEQLYRDAGGHGDTGVPVELVLGAASVTGLAGCRMATWAPAPTQDAGVLLLAIAGVPDVHAAAYHGGQVITWGGEIPLEDMDACVLGAWSLAWHGTETC